MPAAGSGPQLPVDSTGKILGAFQMINNATVWLPGGVIIDAAGNAVGTTPYGTLRVSPEPHSSFFDSFDAGLDTTNIWNAATGTLLTSVTTGVLSFNTGATTTAALFTSIASRPTFIHQSPAFLIQAHTVTLDAAGAAVTQGHRFWGCGSAPATPATTSAATKMTDGIGFEIDTDGKMYACIYVAGVRTVATDLSATGTGYAQSKQPLDGLYHNYIVVQRSDAVYWYLDSLDKPVASAFLAAGQGTVPAVQTLPILYHLVNNVTTQTSPLTLKVQSSVIGDTGDESTQISDGTYPWRKAKVGTAGDQAVSITTPATATNPTPASASIFSPSSELRVAMEGTQLFFDAFDSGLDTLNKWKPPVTGTGGIAATSVAGSGGTTLSSGSTLNGFSLLESQATFQATDPGWLYQRINLNIEFAVLTTGYRFWGRGQTPVTPMIAASLNEAVGWEIGIDGKLRAVMYASGTRTFNQDLSAATGTAKQPADSSAHDYMVWFKGNYMYWAIDSPDNIVAIQTTGANGPNYNNLPVKLLCVSNSGTAVTLSINSTVVGDTGRNNVFISSQSLPWKSAVIEDSGGLRVSSGIPSIIQKKSAVSTGSVASLTVTFDAININGNSIVVACAVGNVTTPTVTDSDGNTYTLAKVQAVGAAANVAIFVSSNVYSGARNVITVSNGGAAASIAVEAYEMDALLGSAAGVVDVSAAATATSTSPATAALSPVSPNEYLFFAVAVGTAAQTITPAAGWVNDSGQLNPVTPSGLFSFASMSQFSGALASLTPAATIVSEPWAAVAVSLRPTLIGVQGSVRVTDGTTNASVKASSTAAVATDTALVVALHPTSPVVQSAITKGTQGTTGVTTQDLKDAGRTSIMLTATVATTATTEVLITLTKSAGLAGTTTGSSLAITSGKKFRIQAITASVRNTTGTTAGVATVRIRAAVAGATTNASPLQFSMAVALPAAATSVVFPVGMIPDGFEIDSNAGTNTFGVTILHPQWVTGSVVATFDISIVGFEY